MPISDQSNPTVATRVTFGGALRRRMRRFARDTGGGVAAVVAIVSPVLVGAMGLGAEAGYWYLTAREVQNAADVAAHAAAKRLSEGAEAAELQTIAEHLVSNASVELTNTDVNLANPPDTGLYIEDGAAIEVTVTETVPRMFSAIYESDPLEISARAVATARVGGRGCVVALSETQAGAITVTGSNMINLIACDFVSNAAGVSFDMQGMGTFGSANCVQTTGTATMTPNLILTCPSARENAAPVADPFALVPEPAVTGACQDGNVGQNDEITQITPIEPHASGMSSMRFCNGLNLRGTVDLDPGLYIVEGGDFQMNANATITGDGVVFYMRDGVEMSFNGTATVNLSGATAGTYNGLLMFGARDATTMSHRINGNFGSVMDGAIYTPESHIDFLGNAQTSFTGCTQIIADTLAFSGGANVMVHCQFPTGPVADIPGMVAIVE